MKYSLLELVNHYENVVESNDNIPFLDEAFQVIIDTETAVLVGIIKDLKYILEES